MGWHNVEKLLEQAANHSSLAGKFWTTFFYILRFLIVISIASQTFGDEFGAFKCNTLTPGCPNICFNDFSPISMIRLWSFQLLSVAVPAIIFIVFTIHKLDKIAQAKKKKAEFLKERKKKREERRKLKEKIRKRQIEEGILSADAPPLPAYKEEEEEEKKDDDGKTRVTKPDEDQPGILLLAYVGQVLFRCASEIIFMWLQFNTYVYKFWVPEIYKCARYPCKNVVDCFVSRPKEKTIIIWIMFCTGILMIILNLVELYHIGIKKIWRAWSTRHYDITKVYKVGSNSDPTFRTNRYNTGYPQAVGIPTIMNMPLRSEYSSDEAEA